MGCDRKQLGFILNLEQHWFTLRRFGNAASDIELEEGNGHWFNLNSFNTGPEWVGRLYLGMVLQQAETEGRRTSISFRGFLSQPLTLGYSVFAVTQADPEAPLALPRTQADLIASTLPEPQSSASANTSNPFSSIKKPSSSKSTGPNPVEEGFEDEDYELQAALQASLMGSGGTEEAGSSSTPAANPSISGGSWARLPNLEALSDSSGSTPEPEFIPPSAPPPPALGSSSALGLSIPGHADVDPVTASMERNRVLLERIREQQEFAAREMWSEEELGPEEQAALAQRRAARQRQEEEEEEELRRAIEESEALAKQQGHGQGGSMDVDQGSVAVNPPQAQFGTGTRVYDDDDAELQAALKASLEHHQSQSSTSHIEADDGESVLSESTASLAEPADAEAALSVDEIRRRRLARFGL